MRAENEVTHQFLRVI